MNLYLNKQKTSASENYMFEWCNRQMGKLLSQIGEVQVIPKKAWTSN